MVIDANTGKVGKLDLEFIDDNSTVLVLKVSIVNSTTLFSFTLF